MSPDRPSSGGYRYFVTEEQIRRYLRIPIERRLLWLDESNRLLYETLSGDRRRAWQSFRDGTI